ncbi:MAG: peroxiredoxin [Nitrososphaera sp.]
MGEKELEISEGTYAPDFTMMYSDGRSAKLSDHRGKMDVVVYFYPKDFTPGCTSEATEFTRDYKKFKDAGIEVVGISPDDEESHKKFRAKMGIPYPLVADNDKRTSKSYGVYGLKSFMGREYMGVNRSTFLVDKSGKIVRIFRRVKPAGHSQEVLEALRTSH